jgi:hypothetical protein
LVPPKEAASQKEHVSSKTTLSLLLGHADLRDAINPSRWETTVADQGQVCFVFVEAFFIP